MAFVLQKEALVTSRSKVSVDYLFDASAQCANVNEPDFGRFMYVINATDNIVIYDPAVPSLGGTTSANRIIFTFDTTAMSDADVLIIIYEPLPSEDFKQLVVLNEILDQLKVNNMYLQEIVGDKIVVSDIEDK